MKLITKADAPDEHLVYGEVYAPDRPDAQGEFMRKDSIQKMAHDFARAGRFSQIDVMHNNKVVPGLCAVESFIARKGDPDFIEGSWVIGMHVPNEDLWERIKKGDINGFSMEAFVTRHDQNLDIEIPPVVSGTTSKTDDHQHKFFVNYDRDGKFTGGITDHVNGHSHRIAAGTHTETSIDHSHRFSSVDDLQVL